jgi:hypothetical protein
MTQSRRPRNSPQFARSDLFNAALPQFRERYGSDYKKASEDLTARKLPLADVTIKNLLSKDADKKNIQHRTQKVIVSFIDPSLDATLYSLISGKILQNDADRMRFKELYGKYRYWRSFAEDPNRESFKVVRGDIEIFESNGSPSFIHTSHNYKKKNPEDKEYEHEGNIYIRHNNMFMLGFGKSVIRLAIISLQNEMHNEFMHGTVLSIRQTTNPPSPFAAAAIVVSEKYKSLYDRNDISIEELNNMVGRRVAAPNGFIFGT